jgi:hypothetical protein
VPLTASHLRRSNQTPITKRDFPNFVVTAKKSNRSPLIVVSQGLARTLSAQGVLSSSHLLARTAFRLARINPC